VLARDVTVHQSPWSTISEVSHTVMSHKHLKLTISMYVPALAIARYSPSCEKLNALIAFLFCG
jgi:hypothetical protein